MPAQTAIFQISLQQTKIKKYCNSISCCRSQLPKSSFQSMSASGPKPNTMGLKSSDVAGNKGVGVSFEQQILIHKRSDPRISGLLIADLEHTLDHLSKWLVIALLGAVLICRHDCKALWAAFGSVVSATISNILKQILNQDRPVSTLRSDPGMPSSHAQAIFFTTVFALISMFDWLGSNAFTISISSITLACGSYLSWLRVRQQFHTLNQVVVGAILGTIISILWFHSWDTIVLEAFQSHLWVRLIVAMGAATYSVGLLLYIVRNLNSL